ncbi:hypothetical protein Bpfe_023342 [Biomphalaria pfeifferi]|uniref:Antistasin-like domain-containing protein n=1 Tax=Biomphalaria pfeifferi TaxID=112525 RepID=A0AAD8F1S1_BIOPF|nr:hypothetical protein Bpfe_023342 [Biomphalaria pfeifferi]
MISKAILLFTSTLIISPALSRVFPVNLDNCLPPPPCAAPPLDCHYVPDADGCPGCNMVCARAACPPVCAIFCQYGNVLDSNGCPTCTCNSAPEKAVTKDPPFLECHMWMKCAQGVCPYTCACQPNC